MDNRFNKRLNEYCISLFHDNNEISIIAYNLNLLDNIKYEMNISYDELIAISAFFNEFNNINQIYGNLIKIINRNKIKFIQKNKDVLFTFTFSDMEGNNNALDKNVEFILYGEKESNDNYYLEELINEIKLLRSNNDKLISENQKLKKENNDFRNNMNQNINHHINQNMDINHNNMNMNNQNMNISQNNMNQSMNINPNMNIIQNMNISQNNANNFNISGGNNNIISTQIVNPPQQAPNENEAEEEVNQFEELKKKLNIQINNNDTNLNLNKKYLGNNILEYLSEYEFNQLNKLTLTHNNINNITNIKSLKSRNLEFLSLSNNKIVDISPLSQCDFPELKKLFLYGNEIRDISPFQNSKFPKLETLSLSSNSISNITSIQNFNFPNLKVITLDNNKIADISVLENAHFDKLEKIGLNNNSIKEINVLERVNFPELKEIYLYSNIIEDMSVFTRVRFNKLELLSLSENNISDISCIENVQLSQIKKLYLNDNKITDINALERIKFQPVELYLSGNNKWSYWLGFYVIDFIKLVFYNIFLMIPIFYVSGVGTYFSLDVLAISLSSLSFIYFISFFCQKEDEGAKILFIFVFGFLIAMAALIIVYQNRLLQYSSSFTQLYKLNLMDLTPVTSMALSLLRIIISFSFWDAADKAVVALNTFLDTELEFEQISGFYRPKYYLYTSFIAQGVNFVIYTLLLILAESGWLTKMIHQFQLCVMSIKRDYIFSKEQAAEEFISGNNIIEPISEEEKKKKRKNRVYDIEITDEELIKKNESKDPLSNKYVKKEREIVNSDKELTTKIKGIRKTFFNCCDKNVRAVNNLYLGLEPNEKFGLLGFNGSGKTTTFKAIINEILIDRGTINLFGYDNKKQFKYLRTMIGYCPQINPLFDFMKVKEIIKYYLELKTCKESVESICYRFGLSKYLNTYTVNLSGGNKRKLSFAIAMMNKPTMLLLDEPSTGVDPDSRRVMWKNINELSNTGHKYNMILTTHSIEEAEILCDTVSWLKGGNFICVGNPEELKLEFSRGYKLHIKFDDTEINKEKSNEKIEEILNNLKELVFGVDEFESVILENKSVYVENYLIGLVKILKGIKDPKRAEVAKVSKEMRMKQAPIDPEVKGKLKNGYEYDAKKLSEELRQKAEILEKQKHEAEYRKFRDIQTDEDVTFLMERAKKLGKTIYDPEILKDPEIIKRFGLE